MKQQINKELQKGMLFKFIKDKYEPFQDELAKRCSEQLDSYSKLSSVLHDNRRNGLVSDQEYSMFSGIIHAAFQNTHAIMRNLEGTVSEMKYYEIKAKLQLIEEQTK
jgi:hypothetical protein